MRRAHDAPCAIYTRPQLHKAEGEADETHDEGDHPCHDALQGEDGDRPTGAELVLHSADGGDARRVEQGEYEETVRGERG